MNVSRVALALWLPQPLPHYARGRCVVKNLPDDLHVVISAKPVCPNGKFVSTTTAHHRNRNVILSWDKDRDAHVHEAKDSTPNRWMSDCGCKIIPQTSLLVDHQLVQFEWQGPWTQLCKLFLKRLESIVMSTIVTNELFWGIRISKLRKSEAKLVGGFNPSEKC